MAYTKTTWNNLSDPPINADNLNKIEQGIYDNSLGIDKINPSGTATTTAEIEEGQVNDVIGFKSLTLKGQTSQYTTTGKNIFDGVFRQGSTSATNATNRICSNNDLILTSGTTYTISTNLNLSNYKYAVVLSDVAFPHATSSNKYDSGWKTATFSFTPEGDYYFAITIGTTNGTDNITPSILNGIWFQLETGSSATSYEKYSGGKASPNPDFPQEVNNVSGDNVVEISNKNLLKTKLPTTTQSGVTLTNNGDGTYTLNGTNSSSGTITFRINQRNGISSDLQNYEDGAYTLDLGVAIPNVQMCLTQNTTYTNFLVTGYGVRLKSGTLSNATNTFIYIAIRTGTTINNVTIRPMLVKGNYTTSTIPTFVAHQGNNFDIDLPVENKLPYPYVDTTKTNNGITYTDLKDGRIKVNGTATANSAFALYGTASSQITLNANYVYGGVNSNVRVRVMNRSSGGTYTTLGNSIGASTKIDRSTASTGYVEISIASGTTVNNLIITPMLSDNEVNAFTPYNENPIELCKIGTYQDYIYKKDGKWYKYCAIGKKVFNGSETWLSYVTNITGKYRALFGLKSYTNNNLLYPSGNGDLAYVLCDNYTPVVAGTSGTYGAHQGISIDANGGLYIYDDTYNTDDISLFKTWLGTHNISVYWVYSTPIEEEITYAPLLRQLDELYNSGLYDVTNISQDNSSEAFILDLEACKNNINGIVEYIRR